MATPPDGPTLKGLQATLDYDPFPVLERVQVPVLAMNGELDKAINSRVSAPIMEAALRKAGNKDFTIIVIPKAGHNFLESETGYGSEFPRLRRYASGYWDPMVLWLRKHVRVKK